MQLQNITILKGTDKELTISPIDNLESLEIKLVANKHINVEKDKTDIPLIGNPIKMLQADYFNRFNSGVDYVLLDVIDDIMINDRVQLFNKNISINFSKGTMVSIELFPNSFDNEFKEKTCITIDNQESCLFDKIIELNILNNSDDYTVGFNNINLVHLIDRFIIVVKKLRLLK